MIHDAPSSWAVAAGGAASAALQRLVSGFASCYPPRSTAYPFVVRSHDAALLLVEVDLASDGALAGPSDRRFWEEVFGDVLRGGADSDEPRIDAAWMVNALCGALAEHRALVFATLLAGHRTFREVPKAEWPDVVAALRARANLSGAVRGARTRRRAK